MCLLVLLDFQADVAAAQMAEVHRVHFGSVCVKAPAFCQACCKFRALLIKLKIKISKDPCYTSSSWIQYSTLVCSKQENEYLR